MVGVIEQLRARDARLIVLTNEGDELLKSPAAEGCLFIEVRPPACSPAPVSVLLCLLCPPCFVGLAVPPLLCLLMRAIRAVF